MQSFRHMAFPSVLAVLLAASASSAQEKKTPDTLTARDVQQQIRTFLEDPNLSKEWTQQLTEVRSLVTLSLVELTYDKQPPTKYVVRWPVQSALGKSLNEKEKQKVREAVDKLLSHVVKQYKGGIMQSESEKLTYEVMIVPPPPSGLEALTQGQIRQRVADYLTHNLEAGTRLRSQVDLQPMRITYRWTDAEKRLTWPVDAVAAVSRPEQVKGDIVELLVTALTMYQGGLITSEEGQQLRPHIQIELNDVHRPEEFQTRSHWSSMFLPTWISQSGPSGFAVHYQPYLVLIIERTQRATGWKDRSEDTKVERTTRPGTTQVANSQPPVKQHWNTVSLDMPEQAKERFRATPPRRKTPLEPGEADLLYCKACRCYWSEDYQTAHALLTDLTTSPLADARAWYYKTLTELALGMDADARRSLQRAVTLHRQGLPGNSEILVALERVQGPVRQWFRTSLERGETSPSPSISSSH